MSLRSVFLEASEDAQRRFNNMSVIQKWQAAYKQHEYDPRVVAVSHCAANIFFLYLCNSLLYVTLWYTTQDYYQNHGEWTVYYMNVLHTFVYINVMANWICVKSYDSQYRKSRELVGMVENCLLDHVIDIETGKNGVAHKNGLLVAKDKLASGQKPLEWHFCARCDTHSPPRSHHCPVCNVCILKRDHHCFFLAVCIGHFNQRYFIILSGYLAIGCTYGTFLVYRYLSNHFFPNCDSWDLFLPCTIYRCVYGDIPCYIVFMMGHLYFLWIGAMLGIGFFFGQLTLVVMGKTSNEAAKKMRICSTSSISENFQDVFGSFWLLNIIFPANILFRQKTDGTKWDKMYAY